MVENTEHVIDEVLHYNAEIGVIESRNDDSRIHQELWMEDQLVVVASPHHPFAGRTSVSLAQLEQAQWVLRESGAGTRAIFDGAVHGLIDNLNVWKEYEQVDVLKSLTKNGQFLSALPLLSVSREVSEGSLVILPTPQLNMARSLAFIWRNDAGENPLRDCLLAEARRQVKRLERENKLMALNPPLPKR
jgi:DNA-binding transcriptional LysR family regulator